MVEENPQVRFAAIKIGPNRFKNVAKVDPLPPIRKTKQSVGQVSINVEGDYKMKINQKNFVFFRSNARSI